MDIDELYARWLPVWRASYFRRLALVDYMRRRALPEVQEHAKFFLDLYAVELPDEGYYGLAERLADEVTKEPGQHV